jgi:choline dehydrogenase
MMPDVIVVGAGSAGCVLATRLSEDPDRNVALIEAGADYPYFRDLPDVVKYLGSENVGATGENIQGADRSQYDWGFHAWVNDTRPKLRIPRGRVIGGTGSVNGYAFLRGEDVDFAAWVAAGNDEWSFNKVLPYYCRLETDLDYREDYHGSIGPMRVSRVLRHNWLPSDHAFEDACIALGYKPADDLNAPGASGVGPTPASSQDGTRMSSARAYLAMARGRRNLRVIPNTLVHRVMLNGGVVRGVQTVASEVIEAPEVIISAGSLKSPHLLMLSGIGPAEQLQALGIPVVANLPGVGQNLRDHPTVVMLWRQRIPPTPAPRSQQGSPRGSAGLRLRLTAPDSDIFDDCTIRSVGSAAMEGGSTERAGMYNMNVGLSLGTSAGEVRIATDDPAELPVVDLRYLSTESDRVRMRHVIKLGCELASQRGLQDFMGEMVAPDSSELADDAALDAWTRRRVRTSHHLSSTCKMGPESDEMAVVDQFGRVRGVTGLRVADASIMPDCTRPNINATTMMIGERIAEFVRRPNG